MQVTEHPLGRAALGAALLGAVIALAACGGGGDAPLGSPASEAGPPERVAGGGIVTPAAPTILTQPQSAAVGVGAGVSFSVVARAAARDLITGYYWYHNDVLKAQGSSLSAYTIGAATAQNAGTYRVEVRSANGGRVASAPASLSLVSGGWAPLGGRAMSTSSASQQPALALCTDPTVAWIRVNAAGVSELAVSRFNGVAWLGLGFALNVDPSASASEPSIDCFQGRPVVAWTETVGSGRNVYVAAWTAAGWRRLAGSALRPELNETAGTTAARPVVRVHPSDFSASGSALAENSALAWVEQWYLVVKRWNGSEWVPYPGGRGPGVGVAVPAAVRDLALAFVEPERTEPVVAWIQPLFDGVTGVYTAVNRGSWTMVGTGASYAVVNDTLNRVGVGVGRFDTTRAPVTVFTQGTPRASVRARKVDPAEFNAPTVSNLRAWSDYGPEFGAGAVTTFAMAKQVFSEPCGFGAGPIVGVLVGTSSGFGVRRSTCTATGTQWQEVAPRSNVAIESGSLAWADKDSPQVAGVALVNGRHDLSVWRFYP